MCCKSIHTPARGYWPLSTANQRTHRRRGETGERLVACNRDGARMARWSSVSDSSHSQGSAIFKHGRRSLPLPDVLRWLGPVDETHSRALGKGSSPSDSQSLFTSAPSSLRSSFTTFFFEGGGVPAKVGMVSHPHIPCRLKYLMISENPNKLHVHAIVATVTSQNFECLKPQETPSRSSS